MNEIAIIIVNWNGEKFLAECFDSLEKQTYKKFEIFFVDNGSQDGSVDFIKNNYAAKSRLKIKIIELKKNTGFCCGNNIGIQEAFKDGGINYILLLNNDTILESDFLQEIARCAQNHQDMGAIQPKVLDAEGKKIDCAGIVFAKDGEARNRGYGQEAEKYNADEEIFGANGTASLFSKKALQKIQDKNGDILDEDFFAYYEDVDLAWRLKYAGFRAYFCPQALVRHLGSATSEKNSLKKAYYLHRNYFFTVFKNYPCSIMIKTLYRRSLSYVRLFFLRIAGKNKVGNDKQKNAGHRVSIIIFRAWMSAVYNWPSLAKKRKYIFKYNSLSANEIKQCLEKYQIS